MFDKSFQDIKIEDINGLITNQMTEGQNLEFKREVWDRSDAGIREMSKDVSAMANGYGGFIVIGMEEEDHSGKALQLVEVPNAEEERDRILGSCRANLHPHIIGFDIKTLSFGNDKNIILIRVPQSLNLHQITFKGLYQFWKRHDRQTDRMSVDEIKDAILKNSTNTEQSQDLLSRRKSEMLKIKGPKMFLSAVPVKLENEIFKIDNGPLRELLKYSQDDRSDGWNFSLYHYMTKPSINGLKVGDSSKISLELYRNGYFEGIVSLTTDNACEERDVRDDDGAIVKRTIFLNISLVEYIYSFVSRLKRIMSLLGYDSPYTIQVSLISILGILLPPHKRGAASRECEIWKEENLELPALTFESINPEIVAKELADRIWQAYGYEHEPYFKDGKFIWA